MPIPKKRVLPDPETLLERIKDSFPSLHWGAYRYVDEGWDHDVLVLDEKFVFRFPNSDDYLPLLKNEVAVLKSLESLVPIRIPRYAYVAADASFAGYPFIPGEPLSRKLFDALPTTDRTKIAKQLASFLSTIHTLARQGHDFESVTLSDMKNDQVYVKTQTKRHLEGALSTGEYQIVQEILADIDVLLQEELPVVFIHGDIYNNHILWDEATQELGLIDFSDMNRGDPAFDFAELYEYGADFVQEIYEYYRGPKDETFLERAWAYQRWVGVFMMVDHFDTHKTSFQKAKETFDRIKQSETPPH